MTGEGLKTRYQAPLIVGADAALVWVNSESFSNIKEAGGSPSCQFGLGDVLCRSSQWGTADWGCVWGAEPTAGSFQMTHWPGRNEAHPPLNPSLSGRQREEPHVSTIQQNDRTIKMLHCRVAAKATGEAHPVERPTCTAGTHRGDGGCVRGCERREGEAPTSASRCWSCRRTTREENPREPRQKDAGPTQRPKPRANTINKECLALDLIMAT